MIIYTKYPRFTASYKSKEYRLFICRYTQIDAESIWLVHILLHSTGDVT